jgi:hypothetical protein
MMVLGVDPGTKRANVKASAGVTWAVVEHDDHSKWVRWVDGGSFDPTRAKIEAFALHMRRVDACGVEVMPTFMDNADIVFETAVLA